jgi:hypothetical protein
LTVRNCTLPWPYVRVFVLRTALLWIAMHAFTRSVTHSFRATLLGLAFAVFFVLVDAERRNERRFLANLGVSRLPIGLVVLLTAVCLEILLRLISGPLIDGLRAITGR